MEFGAPLRRSHWVRGLLGLLVDCTRRSSENDGSALANIRNRGGSISDRCDTCGPSSQR